MWWQWHHGWSRDPILSGCGSLELHRHLWWLWPIVTEVALGTRLVQCPLLGSFPADAWRSQGASGRSYNSPCWTTVGDTRGLQAHSHCCAWAALLSTWFLKTIGLFPALGQALQQLELCHCCTQAKIYSPLPAFLPASSSSCFLSPLTSCISCSLLLYLIALIFAKSHLTHLSLNPRPFAELFCIDLPASFCLFDI